jgi:hypothetical protein
MRFVLVTAQIALTVAMLAGSTLLLRTLWNLAAVPLGYESERVVTMDVTLNVARYPKASRNLFFERVRERIRGIPGTTASHDDPARLLPPGVTLMGRAALSTQAS